MSEHTKMVAELEPSRPMQVRSSFRRGAQGREIVIVLGMHRSGTSLLSNVLHLLGVDMVDEPPHTSPSNEKGFWERQDIRDIHDEILAVLGVPVGSTAHAVPFQAGWWRTLEIRKLKEQLRDLLAAHLSQVRRPWGFKDPRTSRLLPLWGEILEELDISPRFVWAVRHPAESSISMTLKNPLHRPIPVAQSEVMWLAYNYDILRHAGRHWPVIVPFDQWFEDPLAQAKELARELDLVWQGSDHELQSALDHIVSGEQRHHHASGGKLRCNLAISEDIYRTILGIRNGETSEVSEAAAVSLHSLLGAVQPFAIAAKDAKVLKEENQTLARDIRQLRADAAERDRLEALLASAKAAEEALRQDRAAASSEIDQFRAELAAARAGREEAEASLSSTLAELKQLAGERDRLTAQLATAKAAEEAHHKDRDAVARKMDAFRTQISTLSTAKEKIEASHAATIPVLEKLAAQQKADAAERDRLLAQLASAKAAEETHHKDRDAAARKMDAFRTQIATLSAAKEKAEASHAAAMAEMELLHAGQAENAAARTGLERDLAAAVAANTELKAELAGISQSAAALEREFALLDEEMAAMRTRLRAERERHAEAFQALLLERRAAETAAAESRSMDS